MVRRPKVGARCGKSARRVLSGGRPERAVPTGILPADEAKQAELRKLAIAAVAAPQPTYVLEDDGLDDLSNSVLALTRAGRFAQALAACKRLRDEFPDVVDGLERSGLVHAKMGDHATAAVFYRQAYDFVTHPSRRDDYDGAAYYREQMEKEEQLAGLR